MLRFILQRLVQMAILLVGITFISFGIMQLAPGDYFTQRELDPQTRPETLRQLRHDFGLDRPWPVRYVLWLKNAVHGDFGVSFSTRQPVFRMIRTYAFNTLLLSVTTMIFSWAVAIPMGVYAATHKNGPIDRITSFLAFTGISLPGFFVALLALLVAQKTGWLPVGGMQSANFAELSPWGKVLDVGRHLVLPTLVLGTRGVASIMRQMRGNLLDVLGENYVTAARARGMQERVVIVKHAVRNAINPLITIFGYELAGLLAGAALVENVVGWPGLGRVLLDAVRTQDLYVAMGSFVMGSVLLIAGNLVADLLLAATDPRIRYS